MWCGNGMLNHRHFGCYQPFIVLMHHCPILPNSLFLFCFLFGPQQQQQQRHYSHCIRLSNSLFLSSGFLWSTHTHTYITPIVLPGRKPHVFCHTAISFFVSIGVVPPVLVVGNNCCYFFGVIGILLEIVAAVDPCPVGACLFFARIWPKQSSSLSTVDLFILD